MKKNMIVRIGLLPISLVTMSALPTNGDVTVGFSQGDLSASATFSVSGDTLMITLENTATVDVGAPSDVLTGLFFDIDGYVGELTPVSALLTDVTGTPVLFNAGFGNTGFGYNDYAGTGDIGSEVGYDRGAIALGAIGDHAIGHVGMDNFIGTDDRFDTVDAHNLQGPLSPDGIQYSIVNAGYAGGGITPLDGPQALVTTAVKYTFTGFSGFSEGDIKNVDFNYGTDFNPVIPAPGAALLGMLGFSTIGWIKRRFA